MNSEDKNYDSDSLSPLSKANKIAPHPFDTLSCLIMPSDGGVGISGNTGTMTNSYESLNQSSFLMENNMSFINNGSSFGVNNNILPNYLVDQNGNLILLNGFANNNILVNNLAPQNVALYNIPTNHTKSEISDNRISHSNNNLSLFDNNALQQLYLSQSSLVSHIANNNQSTANNCTTTVNTDPYLNLLQQNVALIGQIINTNHELSSPTKLLQHSTPIKNKIKYQQKLNSNNVKNDSSKAKDSLQTKYLQRSVGSIKHRRSQQRNYVRGVSNILCKKFQRGFGPSYASSLSVKNCESSLHKIINRAITFKNKQCQLVSSKLQNLLTELFYLSSGYSLLNISIPLNQNYIFPDKGSSTSHSTKIEATLKSFVDEHFKDMESTWKSNVPPLHPPSQFNHTELLKLTSRSSVISNEMGFHQSKGQGLYPSHNGFQDPQKQVEYETLKFKTKSERVKIRNRRYFGNDTSYDNTKIDGDNTYASYTYHEDSNLIVKEKATSSPLRLSLSGSGGGNRRVMTRGGLPPRRISRAGHERPFNSWYDRGRTSVRSRDSRDSLRRIGGNVTTHRSDRLGESEEDEGEGEKDREIVRISQLIGCELEAYIRDFAPEEPPSPLPTDQLYKLWEMDLNTTSHECNIKRQITEEKNTLLKIGCLREAGFFCEAMETTLNTLAFADPIQALATHTSGTVEGNQNASKLEATTNAIIIPRSNEEEILPPTKSAAGDEIVEESLGTDKALVVLDEDSNPIAPVATITTTTNPVNSTVPRSLVISTEKTHENYMLEEMAWLSTDFLQEHKWKMTVARKVSRGIQKFFEERMLRDEKLKQEEMNYLKKIASRVSKIVWRFWRSISRIADAKAKAIFEIKHQRHLDRQLNAIVGETEKYSDQISKQLLPPPPPTTKNVPEGVEAGGRPTIPKRRVRTGKDNEANSHASPPDSRRTSPRKFPVVKIHKLTEKSELLPAPPDPTIVPKPKTVSTPFKVGKRRKRRSADCILITESVSTNLSAADEPVRPSVIMKQTIKVETVVNKPLVRSLRSKNPNPGSPDPLPARDSASVVDASSALVQLNSARESVIKPCKPVRNGCLRAHSTAAFPDKSIRAMESKESLVPTDLTPKEPHSELVAFDTKMEEMEIKGTPPKLPLIEEETEDSSTDGSSHDRSFDPIKKEEAIISIGMKDGESKGDVPETKDVSKKSLDGIEPESNPTEITDIAAQAQKFQPKGFTLATTEVCTKVPFLLKHTLREYQHIGLDWLVAMHNKNLNGILADEMGLGKTIQTISLLAHLACEKGIWGPHLIVVPTSVMLNWEMEFKKWCPGFKILTYFGSPKERRMKRKGWGFDASESRETPNVVITSYRLVLQDERCFKRKRWSYFVLDEAQNIKNFKSRRWLTLLNFKAEHRLLLTGTPLQNDLMEVWSLMHFLMPRVFANRSEFSHWFVKPLQDLLDSSGQEPGSGSSRCMDASEILKGGPGGSTSSLSIHSGPSVAEAQALVAKLHKILRPFILRRLKREVEKQMPGKFEHVVACRLSKRQRYLYHDFVSRASTRQILESGNFLGVVNALMQLRKVCNHPDLFEERPICSPLVTGRIMSYTAPSLATTALKDDFKIYPAIRPGSDPPETLEICENQRFKCLKLEGVKEVHDDSHGLPKCAHEINSRALYNILLRHEPKYRYVEALSTALSPGQIDFFLNPSSTPERALNIRGLLRPSLRSSFPNSNRTLDLLANTTVSSTILGVDDRSLDGSGLWSPLVNRLVMGDTNSYLQSLQAILERFMIYIPPVTSLSPDLRVSHPSIPGSRQQLLCQTEDYLCLGLGSMPLLRIISNARALRFPEIRLIEYDCGKLQVLKDLLAKLQIDKHRVLIFTQMTKVLDILESFLTYHGYRYLRLDGSTKIEQRQIMMDRFNYDQKIFCFILSTRSGGLGINLTGADTVIFYDSDWNPTMDAQAQDRCHRIGQTREVHIYRLISRYTVEENILKKARQKKLLGDITIEEGNFTTAFFRQDGLKDLFALKSSGEEVGVEEEKKESNPDEDNAENIVESEKAEPAGKSSWFEEALGMAEDEADSKAARLAAREIPLDNEDLKAEFAEPNDESMADGAADGGLNGAKTELSPEEQFEKDLPEELKQYISNLKPIEKMALRIYEHLYCTELYETSATEDVSLEGELEKSEKQSPSHDIDIKEEGSEDEIKSQGANDTTSTESESGEDIEFGTISSFYHAKKGNNQKEEEQSQVDVKAAMAPKRRRRKRFKAFRLSMPKRIKK